jgi:hypothetical protein
LASLSILAETGVILLFKETTMHILTAEQWQAHSTSGIWTPPCTRITVKGDPCKNHIFDGQRHVYVESGEAALDDKGYAMFLDGACSTHRAVEARRK